MGTDQAGPYGFLIGGRYRNRQNEYEVVDFNGGQLRVVYDDGTEAFLTAETQARIIRNIEQETAQLEPYPRTGAHDRNMGYFRTLGFLASRITMMEAIVPYRGRAGFVRDYRTRTGVSPQEDDIGYYVHQEQVDKWGNELRVTFDAPGDELELLDFGPTVAVVVNPSNRGLSWRINRNAFWWDLIQLGFRMGNQQDIDVIRGRIPQVYREEFDNGRAAARN